MKGREIMNRLKELRQEKKLSQKELAKKIGVHYRTLQNWENGESQIKPDKAQALADRFEVSVGYLLGYTEDRKVYDDERLVGFKQNSSPYYFSPKRLYSEEKNKLKNHFIKLLRDDNVFLSDENIELILSIIDNLRLDNPNTVQGQVFLEKFVFSHDEESLQYWDALKENGFSIVLGDKS